MRRALGVGRWALEIVFKIVYRWRKNSPQKTIQTYIVWQHFQKTSICLAYRAKNKRSRELQRSVCLLECAYVLLLLLVLLFLSNTKTNINYWK